MDEPRGAHAILEAYFDRHQECDLEGVLELFAEDAVLEDPVGSPVRVGREALREFFRTTHQRNGRLRIERPGPVVVCGREAACHIRASAVVTGFERTLDVYYTVMVDEENRSITSLRAFFAFD